MLAFMADSSAMMTMRSITSPTPGTFRVSSTAENGPAFTAGSFQGSTATITKIDPT